MSAPPSPSLSPADGGLARALGVGVPRALGRGWAVESIAELAGGHAGCMFRVAVVSPDGLRRRFAVKCSPPGVALSGAADVVKQAPLLAALNASRVRVPQIAWYDDGADSGVPHVAFEWVSGAQNFPLALRDELLPDSVWFEAITALSELAGVDPGCVLKDGVRPRTLASEIEHWRPTYQKALDPALIEQADRARSSLLQTTPEPGPLGVTHGDYQTSNLMIENGRISTIIDWDLAAAGDTLTDLGWLMMWADPQNWRNEWRSRCAVPLDELSDRYFSLRQLPQQDMRWYMGLACYKFASITCHSLKLHRTGRRVDDVWERFALDAPHLFDRACELSGAADG